MSCRLERLGDADGIILIGGGTSVLVTGHLALGFRVPLLALATFGGAAGAVWEAIIPDRDLPTEAEGITWQHQAGLPKALS